jgi:hypothetical protein
VALLAILPNAPSLNCRLFEEDGVVFFTMSDGRVREVNFPELHRAAESGRFLALAPHERAAQLRFARFLCGPVEDD